tara:strand:+ start:21989 stop:22525 length:537 start_codon:yes stop_codon:yes gene_type:complete
MMSKMNNKKMIALVMVCSFMAGCADGIPEPDAWFDDDEITEPDWITEVGEFTIMFNATTTVEVITEVAGENNTTTNETTTMEVAVPNPVIWINTNTTYGWIEVMAVNYTATHLSFEIIDNTVIFNNYSFDVGGYLVQDGFMWNSGYAPNLGNATLYVSTFPFDISVNYTVTYRVWNGR